MGTYFNPKNESFNKVSNSTIYAGKTGLLRELTIEGDEEIEVER